MNQNDVMSESAMNLSYAAIDKAAENLELTKDTFNSFLLLLDNQGEIKLAKLTGVTEQDQLFAMVGNILNQCADTLIAYSMVYDGVSDIGGCHIVVETGCLDSGYGIKMVQEYSLNPNYQDVGNIQVFDEKLPLRIGGVIEDAQSRNDTKEMIQPLCRAPFAIFQKIAGADGVIDSKKVDAFVSVLGEGLSMSEIPAAIIQQAINDAEVYMRMVQNQALSAEEEIVVSKELLSSEFEPNAGKEYISFLNNLSDRIVQPKKRSFFKLSQNLSEAQLEAIQSVKDVLS